MTDPNDPPVLDAETGPDITLAILGDHEWFRRRFIALDDLRAADAGVDELSAAWTPLADRLDVHAIAEEEIFYPQLLRSGDDAEEETLDAIGDHNEIRDGVHAARKALIGTDAWWDAVREARVANDEHMAEEERDGIADFRRHADAELRSELGKRFAAFLTEHRTIAGLDTSDKDPRHYVDETEQQIGGRTPSGSLGIGSLKGRST
ncbi:hemerythrin domain-containing protein [Pseudonocardia sp. GCM10023141]|uniref:hemerythrin domain-containing protein n=1 Tax=Pseudonocardia sp. GCM10023141 TaxID=3252653 RepID=UPI003621901A